ncbi:MAG: DUF2927 domain-containing protein [Rhodospirillales bacterium]|nr:DUF2927 domain-containing protein [Alphaproteobacteria bacterium]MBL6948791.1 DUF2927 domain-containing protein [Rhodospirillales bacterium]
MPRVAPLLALILLAVSPCGPAWGAGEKPAEKAQSSITKPSIEELVKNFDTIIFQSEFKGVAKSKVIKKWTGPLRIAIRTFEEATIRKDGREVVQLKQVKVKKPHLRFVQNHLNSLARATGLKTEDSKKNGQPVNFTINFVPRLHLGNPYLAKANPKLLRKMAAEGGCYFVLWADNVTGVIKKVVIVVNAERLLIRTNHCLLEEMTQSLGLPNDSNLITPSIFADSSRRTELTRSDLMILKALYDPRMKAGLPREKALKVAEEVLRELDAKLP